MTELFIGLMSGTSLDGVDAVLVDLEGDIRIVADHYTPFSEPLKKTLHHLCTAKNVSIEALGEHHTLLGALYADTVIQLLASSGTEADQVSAIGCHGQTIRHLPEARNPFSLQIGNAANITENTGITTVANFRSRDIAAGGQGAPLVPAFHKELFHTTKENRAVVNIGGMANITLLPADLNKPTTGFDTGPGNTLLDAWFQIHNDAGYDVNGDWGSTGDVIDDLLNALLNDEYFSRPPPKSTGREYFNLEWLEEYRKENSRPEDMQATLCELTARSIKQQVSRFAGDIDHLIVCGGGACNTDLMRRLVSTFHSTRVETSDVYDLAPNHVEAAAFAWLAKQTLLGEPGNIPEVTGARHATVLGAIYRA